MFSVEDREKLLKTKLTHIAPKDLVAHTYDKAKNLDDISKMQYVDINFWLQGDILLKADKMSMAHCLESRVPFLDIKVFNYAKRLPTEYKVNDTATKRAFRIAAKKHIPEKTANKKKLGFPVPIRVWLCEDEYYNKVELQPGLNMIAIDLGGPVNIDRSKSAYGDAAILEQNNNYFTKTRKILNMPFHQYYHDIFLNEDKNWKSSFGIDDNDDKYQLGNLLKGNHIK